MTAWRAGSQGSQQIFVLKDPLFLVEAPLSTRKVAASATTMPERIEGHRLRRRAATKGLRQLIQSATTATASPSLSPECDDGQVYLLNNTWP